MPIWWGCFAYSIIVSIIGMYMYKSKQQSAALVPVEGEKTEQYKSIGLFMAMLSFALLVFFVGNRSVIHDTQEYQFMYDIFYTDDLNQIPEILNGTREVKGPLFFVYLVLFKHFTHGTYTDWFMSMAIFQAVSIAVLFYRYSVNYAYSMYLFFASGMFIWMVNGIRQFIAVTIMLFAFEFVKKRKLLPFLILVLVSFYFHSSAIIWVPVFFIINFEPWSKKFVICAILFVLAVLFVSRSSILNNTEYDYLLTDERTGINPIRVLVCAVPSVIAFVGRKKIKSINNTSMNLMINLSVISLGCYVFGMFSNGVATRIVAFFDIFSWILLPWLLKNAFDESMGKSITIASFIGYFAYFWYNMYGAHNGIYVSDTLGLSFWM